MHHANYYYGHGHVLARYCGLDEPMHPPRMQGYLQHGWNIGDGLAPGVPFVAGSRLLVWSEETRRRAFSQGRRNVVAVGSPFAYLMTMTPETGTEPEGTIFYPFHGWEGQQVHGDHQRLIDEVKATEDGPITVCLYWNEHRVRSIRRLYERAGFRVICHGYRGFWWRDHDREFLDRQLAELRRHRRVVSNRLCSAIWYGALAGCDVAVYGDPMVLEAGDMTFGGEPRLRRQWPEVYGTHTDRAACHASARRELGADILATPIELAYHLGWHPPAARAA
ncbi:hypothetical protein [Jidongwangia harbinensis]|uniref:hypothetical protein n=1 Tax=Jidongwangia harbinensis TaxID=2878561 RepID=UPI001CD97BEC|nr:hypothetical protein [Jidongwangia harbinensis]MCA2213167.1 hypothetical protein [Jidongwangia harbinensis]